MFGIPGGYAGYRPVPPLPPDHLHNLAEQLRQQTIASNRVMYLNPTARTHPMEWPGQQLKGVDARQIPVLRWKTPARSTFPAHIPGLRAWTVVQFGGVMVLLLIRSALNNPALVRC